VNVGPAILLATGASVALMAGLWIVGLAIRNWSVVDPGWALCVVLCAAIYAATSGAPLLGPTLLATLCAGIWGLRHAWLLLSHRVIGQPEEGRYVQLRTKWGRGAFFAFFQAQAVLAVLLSSPFLLATRTASTALPLPALFVFLAGFLGEAVADAQLAAWKRDPSNRGRTCRRGLWAWSRHPNYFFEFVIWISFALMALGHPLGWIAWTAPATILLLLLFVTGIPPAEQQALKSRGEDYLAYRRTTSAFVPLPPRRAKA
jgi:steroid 5-alpha reductase family enzyme